MNIRGTHDPKIACFAPAPKPGIPKKQKARAEMPGLLVAMIEVQSCGMTRRPSSIS